MTGLDPTSVSAATALVVTVCGVLYLVDSLHRRGNAAARVWSVAFVTGILTTFAYLVWTASEDGWAAGVVGNVALVATIGMLWLGCSRFNRPLTVGAAVAVACAAALTLVAGLAAGPEAGDWAGAWAMFVSITVLSGLGCVESRRGRLAGFRAGLWLTVAFGAISLFYLARTVLLLVTGVDTAVFRTWFGTASASALTIVLTITAVVSMTVLRVQELAARHRTPAVVASAGDQGYLEPETFSLALAALLRRAGETGQMVALVVVRLDGLDEISAAFGSHHARELTERWCRLTLHTAPRDALLALDDGSVLVALPDATDRAAANVANRLSSQVAVELAETEVEVVPTLGVGVASAAQHRGAADLIAAAQAAAWTSVRHLDCGVVIDAPPAPPDAAGRR